LSPSLILFAAFLCTGLFLLAGMSFAVLTSFQYTVASNMRATVSALCLMLITLLGYGVGPPLMAFVQSLDSLRHFPAAVLIVVTAVGAAPGGLLLLWSARTMHRPPAMAG
jgi:hypothetical protein